MKLVIRGAHYLVNGEILIPHFTGEYITVDCTRYLTKKNFLEICNKKYFKEWKDDYIEHEGIKYYYAKYSPYDINEDWELLSELKDLYCEDGYNY